MIVTLDPKIIFIITLNVKDTSLSGFDCNNKPNSLEYEFDCKIVS